ncbi:MAG TPA: hypothetical protein VIK86_10345 [Candidatus Paceibacterota bacterium]
MKIVANVTQVSRYSFDDKETGRSIKGTTIMYQGEVVNSDTKKGQEQLTIKSDSYITFEEFTKVPGQYELNIDLAPGKQGQVKMVYKSAKFLN